MELIIETENEAQVSEICNELLTIKDVLIAKRI